MYLKSLKIINFRKFRTTDNIIGFVNSQGITQKGKQNSESNEKNVDGINIASVTTLIVGKNNAGKTTVLELLKKLIDKSTEKKFSEKDFNFRYLEECIESIDVSEEKMELPYMEFVVTIALEEESNDRVTNLVPFMLLENVEDSELKIYIRYEVADNIKFKNEVMELVRKEEDKNVRFNKFLKFMEETDFKLNYYDKNGNMVDRNFKLSNIIELKPICVDNVTKGTCLTDAFNKIISYRYKESLKTEKAAMEDNISDMNGMLSANIKNSHTTSINSALHKIVSMEKVGIELTADITFEKVIKNLLRYEYVEGDMKIPENQFGAGYTNLMMIIADLMDYMEHYPDTSFNSKINLISIEEPETYMHPQMQELFIKNISDAIQELLLTKNKKVNSQLIITTHSSHILNSKIHSGNSFDNINYVYENQGSAAVAILNNAAVMSEKETKLKKSEKENEEKKKIAQFNFLKKHIKYKISEMFFSDAVIFVEGVTEETVLPFYIERMEGLNKHYISIFNINGAYGLVYYNLIKTLKVPTLIITDLDINEKKAEGDDKENKREKDVQITDLTGKITTNQTIRHFCDGNDDISKIKDFVIDENIYLAYQGKINGYYATSFEEAYILTNYENQLLNDVLKDTKPGIYKRILGPAPDCNQNKEHSYEWQKSLSDDKSNFANGLLFTLIMNQNTGNSIPKIPDYIAKGLSWLERELKRGESE